MNHILISGPTPVSERISFVISDCCFQKATEVESKILNLALKGSHHPETANATKP